MASKASSPVLVWSNWTVKNNDFQQIHRMNGEFQPQGAANVVVQNNSIENPYQPQPFSFGCRLPVALGALRMDCSQQSGLHSIDDPTCASNTPATSPVPQVLDNVLIQNEPPGGKIRLGFYD